MKLTVIIPIYNEVESLQEIVKRVKNTNLAWEIILVDDGSKDGTRDLLTEMDGKDNSPRYSAREKPGQRRSRPDRD